jgi:hypothetical protein
MLSLFANTSLMKSFLSYVGLVPLVLRYIEKAEETGLPGVEKKEIVTTAIASTLAALNQKNYLPPELIAGVGKPTADLVDTMVTVYNAVGFFHKQEKPAPPLPFSPRGLEDRTPAQSTPAAAD